LEQIHLDVSSQPPQVSPTDNSTNVDLKKIWTTGQQAFEQLNKLKEVFSETRKTHKNKSSNPPKKTMVDGMAKPVFENGGVVAQSTGTGLTAGGLLYTFSKLDLWVQITIVAGISFIVLGAVATSLYNRHRKVAKLAAQEADEVSTLHSGLSIEALKCKKISQAAQKVLQSSTPKELDENLSALASACGKLTLDIIGKDFTYEIGLLKGKYRDTINNTVDEENNSLNEFKHEVITKIINPLATNLDILKGKYKVTDLTPQSKISIKVE
jgi:hypothetical protein